MNDLFPNLQQQLNKLSIYRPMSNIKDVTHSQKDWDDFWYGSESEGREFTDSEYVNKVLGLVKYPSAFKRDSKLSE
jgi:hypothetical protein|tara:strand:- start:215 stop:442 length:228 start_codon:yes stop_codon:yes gene_type:complete